MKKSMFFAVMAIAALILFAGSANAATFTPAGEVTVSADDNGVVLVAGAGAGELTLIQYCQWEFRGDCSNNVSVSNSGTGYQLNREGLANHQNSFNFHKKGSNVWLLIPNKLVKTGKNIQVVTKDKDGKPIPEGARFQYTGPGN